MGKQKIQHEAGKLIEASEHHNVRQIWNYRETPKQQKKRVKIHHSYRQMEQPHTTKKNLWKDGLRGSIRNFKYNQKQKLRIRHASEEIWDKVEQQIQNNDTNQLPENAKTKLIQPEITSLRTTSILRQTVQKSTIETLVN